MLKGRESLVVEALSVLIYGVMGGYLVRGE